MVRLRLLVAVLMASVTPGAAAAQGGGGFRQPPRMLRSGEEAPKGTAMLRGVVVAADTGAPVQVLRHVWVSGARTLQPAGGADRTDDQGTYRIFGLQPGEYLVTATLRDERPMLRGGPAADLPDSGYAPTYFPGTSSIGDAQKVVSALIQGIKELG